MQRLMLWKQINMIFLFPVVLASAVVIYAILNLDTIAHKVAFIEIADDINLSLLELRRYEKNILLFREENNLKKFNEYLGQLDERILKARETIFSDSSKSLYLSLRENIASYKDHASSLISIVHSEHNLLDKVRPLGRIIETSSLNREKALELRRHEKNFIIYKEQQAVNKVRNIAGEIVELQPTLRLPVSKYLATFNFLVEVQSAKDEAVEKMRLAGRGIENITLRMSESKRNAIDETISFSKGLLLGSLLFLLIATSFVGCFFSVNLANVLKKIEKSLNKLKSGDFTSDIDVNVNSAPEEIVSFVNTYNQSIEKLARSRSSLNITLKKLEDANRELLEKQDELVEARKLTAMRLLAAEIAHEINNPLSSVTTFLGIFCEEAKSDPAKKETFELILKEVNRCQAVLKELAGFARKEPLRLKEVTPLKVIKDAIKVAGRQHEDSGVNLIAFFSELPEKVVIDPVLIHQVIVNILSNAYHFTGSGGSIELEGYTDCHSMVIEIKDTGIGISEENIPLIFEPFFSTRTEAGGSGLGLAIAKKIIERHNGYIQVESRLHEGTIFRIALPIVQET